MIAEKEQHQGSPRAKYIARSYLYDTAEGLRRTAERLANDADLASEPQAQLMRKAAERLNEIARRFDEQAGTTPVEDSELPFS